MRGIAIPKRIDCIFQKKNKKKNKTTHYILFSQFFILKKKSNKANLRYSVASHRWSRAQSPSRVAAATHQFLGFFIFYF